MTEETAPKTLATPPAIEPQDPTAQDESTAQEVSADAPPWLVGLNPAQREAVEYLHGPLLVLSGAGTGKTRVLTSRLVHLIATEVAKPWNILAVTFTNKAAQEMKGRVEAMMGDAARQIWFGTFHALASRILRRHAECVGLRPNFTILDTDDQLRLIKQLMEAADIDPKRWPPRVILATINRWKDKGLTPQKVPPTDEMELAEGRGMGLYQDYQRRLLELNACDFGDLLLHNLTIFNDYPDILAEYHQRLTHLLVDEYQDTNIAQYLWVRLLAQKGRNLCCVGDDDQSIYGWRGAEIANMLKFQEVYPEAVIIRLEQNYRSTGHILAAASAVIANNESRLGKELYTSIEAGEPVRVSGYWDGASEARTVADTIDSLIKAKHTGYNEIAVLVRAGFQTREFEERFIQAGLPYRVVGAKFYERQEIRDAVAYLRVIDQPADDLAFERIINTPRRGIGGATIESVRGLAGRESVPMLAAAEKMLTGEGLKAAAKRNLAGIVNAFALWREDARTLTHTDLAMKVLDESGYTAFWQKQKTPDAEGRLDNLKELITAMGEFENLGDFLEHIALVMDGDNTADEGEVTLMTLHAAKGLEFDTVFLPGWEEGLFPSQRTLDEKGSGGLEEERRLAYVGITRAERRLYISYTSSRRMYGRLQAAIPSRFIAELPPESVIEDIEHGMIGAMPPRGGEGLSPLNPAIGGGYGGGGYGPGWGRLAERRGAGAEPAPVSNRHSDSHGHDVGDRVFHVKFGTGNVTMVDGDKLTIAFDKAGEKKVVAGFVEAVASDGREDD